MGETASLSSGPTQVFGGAGDDTIGSPADGTRQGVHVRDYVFCGGGDYTVFADESDFVASDCERVVGG
jgi:hypothetical protein